MPTTSDPSAVAHAPLRAGTPSASAKRNRAALKRLRARNDISDSAKLVGSVLLESCWYDDQAASFLSNAGIAKLLGWAWYKDKGQDRVRDALAELEAIGFCGRVAGGRFPRWFATVGRPRLAIQHPSPETDRPRYIILWGKFEPGEVEPEGCEPPLVRKHGSRARPSDGRTRRAPAAPCPGEHQGVGALPDRAPTPPEGRAPGRPPFEQSYSEPPEEHVNVSEAPAPGEQEPSPKSPVQSTTYGPPRDRAAIMTDLAERQGWEKFPLLAADLLHELQDGGHPIPPFRGNGGRMPPRPTTPAAPAKIEEAPRSGPPPAPAAPLAATTEDLVRALLRPGASQADERTAADAIVADLDDPGWRNFHRTTMAEVRAGDLMLKVVISALRQVREVARESKARIYHDALNQVRYAPDRRKNRPRPRDPQKFPAGAARETPPTHHYTVSQ